MKKRPPISVYVLTGRNSRTLECALKSISGWADEIVVVDSMQEELTAEIGRRYATKFIQQKWQGFQAQYQFASDNCTHDWRMFVDADEEISDDLKQEIDRALIAESDVSDEAHTTFIIPRRTYFLGRWIAHGSWIHDEEVRLYFRNTARWTEGLHSALATEGKEAHLSNHYRHYTYRNISDWIQTMDHYTDVAAASGFERGKRASLMKLIFEPLWYFVKNYIIRRGFLDGIPGLIVYASGSFYVFMKYAKLWEKQKGL